VRNGDERNARSYRLYRTVSSRRWPLSAGDGLDVVEALACDEPLEAADRIAF